LLVAKMACLKGSLEICTKPLALPEGELLVVALARVEKAVSQRLKKRGSGVRATAEMRLPQADDLE
jgi:hypothetical protein